MKPLPICDDSNGRHFWYEPFTDGDTCACGRFYLDLYPVLPGIIAEIREAPQPEETR